MLEASSISSPAATVSIAMCTYNGARFLEDQLQSIVLQTLPPFELVICDDGSSDATLSIVEAFATTAPFPVRLHKNPVNLGYTGNFEKAITLCSGEFIALCDQDDLWHPEKLATQVSIFRADPSCGGVFTNGDLIYPGDIRSNRTLWQSIRFGPEEQKRFAHHGAATILLHGNVVTGMTLIFRASLRDKLLPISRKWIHDAWLAWMICLNSKLTACPARLVSYRVHDSQQVGVPLSPTQKLRWVHRNGLSAYFSRARRTSLAGYRDTVEQFQDLLDYLESFKGPIPDGLLAHIEKKLLHTRLAAGTLAQARRQRIGPVLRNAGAYFRYSKLPFRAIFRDLVI